MVKLTYNNLTDNQQDMSIESLVHSNLVYELESSKITKALILKTLQSLEEELIANLMGSFGLVHNKKEII